MSRWAVISGEREHRKSEYAWRVAEELRARGLRVGGFVQARRYRGEQKYYELLRVGRPESALLAVDGVAAKGPSQEGFCSYAFDTEVFALAQRWLEQDAPSSEVVILDDVSKLEVSGKGHAASVRLALAQPDDTLVVLCARASQLFYVIENFGLPGEPVAAIDLSDGEEARAGFIEALAAAASRRAAA